MPLKYVVLFVLKRLVRLRDFLAFLAGDDPDLTYVFEAVERFDGDFGRAHRHALDDALGVDGDHAGLFREPAHGVNGAVDAHLALEVVGRAAPDGDGFGQVHFRGQFAHADLAGRAVRPVDGHGDFARSVRKRGHDALGADLGDLGLGTRPLDGGVIRAAGARDGFERPLFPQGRRDAAGVEIQTQIVEGDGGQGRTYVELRRLDDRFAGRRVFGLHGHDHVSGLAGLPRERSVFVNRRALVAHRPCNLRVLPRAGAHRLEREGLFVIEQIHAALLPRVRGYGQGDGALGGRGRGGGGRGGGGRRRLTRLQNRDHAYVAQTAPGEKHDARRARRERSDKTCPRDAHHALFGKAPFPVVGRAARRREGIGKGMRLAHVQR